MTKIIPFKERKPPVVQHKKDRSQHVGKTGKWHDAEARALEKLLKSGVTRSEAIQMTMRVTGRSYKSVIVKIDSLRPRQQQEKYTSGPPAPKQVSIDPQSPVALMLSTLNGRVTVTDTGYRLDGRPSSFYLCVREANRVRGELGQPQIKGSPEWVV